MLGNVRDQIVLRLRRAEIAEMRSEFDYDYYHAHSPDVAAANVDAVLHYRRHGWREGRDPNARFKTRAYLAANPDVAASGINPFLHYIRFGKAEGRSPAGDSDSDPLFALSPQQLDLVRRGFDANFYLSRYADVRHSGADPLDHYCEHGWKEGRDPSRNFDTKYYLANNPDVAASGVNPFWHYLNSGMREGRIGLPEAGEYFFGPATPELRGAIPWRDSCVDPEDLDDRVSLIFGQLPDEAAKRDAEEKLKAYDVACKAFERKRVIYTASFGGYDNLTPVRATDTDVDYVLFTDVATDAPEGWQVCIVPPLFEDPTRSARVLKALPHLLFRQAEFWLWIDGSTVMRAPDTVMSTLVGDIADAGILLHSHSQRHCVYAEAHECKAQKKEDDAPINALMRAYQRVGYPRQRGLYETAQVLRRNSMEVALFNERWWEIMRDFSRRDQLSFPFVQWRMGTEVRSMSGTQWIDANFKNHLHAKTLLERPASTGVTLVMLVRNQPDLTETSIRSLLDTTDTQGLDLELVVVDNASDAETKALLSGLEREYKQMRVSTNAENKSFSEANNVAAAASEHPYVCFINNDVEVRDSSWLQRVLRVMEDRPDVAAVGPILLYDDYDVQSAGIRIEGDARGLKVPATEIKVFQQPKVVDGLTGGCLLVRKEIHAQIGGFDERFWYGQEDIDYCLRLRELGHNLFLASDAEMIHHESRTRVFGTQSILNRQLLREKWRARYGLMKRSAEGPRIIRPYAELVNSHPLRYRTYDDVVRVIRKNIGNLPINPDLVVGIPRSGMFAASQIAQLLNCPLVSFDQFIAGVPPLKGDRPLRQAKGNGALKVLIVDDSINAGRAFERAAAALPLEYEERTVQARFLAVFGSENWVDESKVTVLERCVLPRIFQWNYRNHGICQFACYDLDGVLCADPAPEQNDDGERYVEFLRTAQPLTIPAYPIMAIVTSRLEKYRAETEAWLAANGVKYKSLHMIDLETAEERRRLKAHAPFKAKVYGSMQEAKLFVESEPRQAQAIFDATGKPVICTGNDQLYSHKR